MPQGGPWVNMAVLCESAGIAPDGLPYIRGVTTIVGFSFEMVGDGEPDIRQVAQPLTLLLSLVAGSARGEAMIRIDVDGPDGMSHLAAEARLPFNHDRAGHWLPIEIPNPFWRTGDYWFNVSIEGRLLTRIPVEVQVHVTRYPLGTTLPEPKAPGTTAPQAHGSHSRTKRRKR
jgi:hypothetical protein